jgi:hypothetical protein
LENQLKVEFKKESVHTNHLSDFDFERQSDYGKRPAVMYNKLFNPPSAFVHPNPII